LIAKADGGARSRRRAGDGASAPSRIDGDGAPQRRGRAAAFFLPAVVTLWVAMATLVEPSGPAWPPEGAPPFGLPEFVNVTGEAGLASFRHAGWMGEVGNGDDLPFFPESMGPGACWLDFDADGWLDLYLVNGVYQSDPALNDLRHPHSMLFRNLADGTFADVSEPAGVALVGLGQGCAAADYDNDGLSDLYVTAWGGGTLFRNLGEGTFANVTSVAGVDDGDCGEAVCWSTTATWFDYDRDGCLDLFVAHFTPYDLADPGPNAPGPGQSNRLFRSACDGTFQDATMAAGLSEVKDSWASVAADLDDDGWPDLYVANDADPNDLYRNRGDATFVGIVDSVANNYGCSLFFPTCTPVNTHPRNGMGAAVGDFDADGRLDIVTTNYVNHYNGVFRASGADYVDVGGVPPFDDAGDLSGWAPHWFDLDNDGLTDLMVVNSLPNGVVEPRQPLHAYRNLDGASFAEVAPDLGPDFQPALVGRGAAWGDYDNDGAVDVLVAEGGDAATHLFHSELAAGNFLTLDLVGAAPGVARDAIGARVTVLAPGLRPQTQEKAAGDGLMSTSDPRLHFGLGAATSAILTVRWPDGSVEAHAGLRANSFLRLVQGAPGPVPVRVLPLLELDVPDSAAYGALAALDAGAQAGAGTGLASVHWDFGDGTTGEGGELFHGFRDVGSLLVRATATDTLGRAKTTAARVVVHDQLAAAVVMDRTHIGPADPALGRVEVRFSDGAPVAGAGVHVHVVYSSGVGALDVLMQGMPQAVRELAGYAADRDLDGVTGPDGNFAFAIPYSLQSPSDYASFQASHPGRYTVTATGGARGSAFEPAATVYAVGAPTVPG
jgi:enediyne biosynthesis protein E4